MKLCDECWKRLKAAIDARGLSGRIRSAEQHVEEIRMSLEQGFPADVPLDPLMVAHNMILQQALYYLGLEALFLQPDGTHVCPICALTQRCVCGQREECRMVTWWDPIADNVLEIITAQDGAQA